jgi:hypothetical protein
MLIPTVWVETSLVVTSRVFTQNATLGQGCHAEQHGSLFTDEALIQSLASSNPTKYRLIDHSRSTQREIDIADVVRIQIA